MRKFFVNLESDRKKKLLEEEERWRQKSRAIWIASGDKNTKFFHQFARYRRNKKYVWEIEDDSGKVFVTRRTLRKLLSTISLLTTKQSDSCHIEDQIETARLFPRMVTQEDATVLEKPCSLKEILVVLQGFSKDKSPGPDDWTIEFFLHFFDLVGQDLLEMVEEARQKGKVQKNLNATFIALIPKVNAPRTFSDYRPIALCNLCYKIISKLIALRLRPILSRVLSEEQLGFLKGRQISDAIGTLRNVYTVSRQKRCKQLF
jgi:hypothetical protein